MIRTAVADGLRVITLDRPERRNALTPAGLTALESAFDDATEPVVYLRGADESFCAGADLDVVASLSEGAEAFARHGQRVARAIETYDGAVVAGIDGAARGGGVELALACDLRVATPAATFAETGVRLGLFGAWGGTARLPSIIGRGEALDFSLSGRVVDATEARQMGLVTRIVEEPRRVAATLTENDPEALRTVKRLVAAESDQETAEDREAAAFARLHESFEPSDRNG